MTVFTILLGGNFTPSKRTAALVAGTRSVAADSGMRHAKVLGLTPELWVGDFDSASAELRAEWPNVPQRPFDPKKSDTDGAIAAKAALDRGATSLIFVGALGGERTDHALMHLLFGLSLQEKGISVTLTSGEEEAWPLEAGERIFNLPEESLFSIIAFSDLSDLSISNARYPLDAIQLQLGSSRTISNVALGPVTITIGSGKAILLARPFDLTGA
ncbi:thiamine diphosphokinase [Rhizobium sp. L1K21]|uniref:thiamine diphosphokinase n=1 Tax=Rhizobium sp. L1K21 TaxID=2954933 RepID=UPI0020935A3F|nr:thiamine diphosphokinase [Rhizobium sp. L1K21]MCO6188059.1 thiamine diphosphokinase [Rhizobium sp. L1K21]